MPERFGHDVVPIGTADTGSQLREQFDIAGQFPMDLSTTIVPVVIAATAGSSGAEGGIAFVAGSAPANAAVGRRGFGGIFNPSTNRIVRVSRIRFACNGPVRMLLSSSEIVDESAPIGRRAIVQSLDTREGLAAAIYTDGDSADARVVAAPANLVNQVGYNAGIAVQQEVFPKAVLAPGEHLIIYLENQADVWNFCLFEGMESVI